MIWVSRAWRMLEEKSSLIFFLDLNYLFRNIPVELSELSPLLIYLSFICLFTFVVDIKCRTQTRFAMSRQYVAHTIIFHPQ